VSGAEANKHDKGQKRVKETEHIARIVRTFELRISQDGLYFIRNIYPVVQTSEMGPGNDYLYR
jgi:hypothetical protein